MGKKHGEMVKRIMPWVAAVALFFLYSWLPRQGFALWNSPDETAVAFVSQSEAVGMGLYTPQARGADVAGGLAHPRSMTVIDGRLVPSGFIGWPWLLRVVRETPLAPLWIYMPAIVAILGVLSLRYIVARLSGNVVWGWLAAFALAVHPAWWYFANRGLLPNVAFVSFGLMAAVCVLWVGKQGTPPSASRGEPRSPQVSHRGVGFALLAGCFLAITLAVRASEAVWLFPCMVFFAWRQWGKNTVAWWSAGCGFLVSTGSILAVNAAVYVSPFALGYAITSDVAPVISLPGYSDPAPAAHVWWQWLFPFGIHEMNTLRNVWNYLGLPWWFTVWGIVGAVWIGLRHSASVRLAGARHCAEGVKQISDEAISLSIACAFSPFVALYLLVLYGSWNLSDNPTPGEITIGVSYMRYWLPIFVALSVGASWVWLEVGKWLNKRWGSMARNMWFAVVIVVSVGMGWWQAFSGMEGLWAVKSTLQKNTGKQALVVAHTQENDILLTMRDDKVLFPKRAVVTGFLDRGVQARLGSIVTASAQHGWRVFYAGPSFSPTDEAYMRETVFTPQQLAWEEVVRNGAWGVWRIKAQERP